eukprot:scaffold148514_cov22-Tisochrysis_lutea.AAC.2
MQQTQARIRITYAVTNVKAVRRWPFVRRCEDKKLRRLKMPEWRARGNVVNAAVLRVCSNSLHHAKC